MALSRPTRATVTIPGEDNPPPPDTPEVAALREALASSRLLLEACEESHHGALDIIARAKTDMDANVNRWVNVTRWTGKLTQTQRNYAVAALRLAREARERLG